MTDKPSCLILINTGKKKSCIDFDSVYNQAVLPIIKANGINPIFIDSNTVGNQLNKVFVERLLLSDYAIIDITNANSNLWFTFGIRYALRPLSTIFIYSKQYPINFDLKEIHAISYSFAQDKHLEIEPFKQQLIQQLMQKDQNKIKETLHAQQIIQFMKGYKVDDIARLKTDTFREQLIYDAHLKESLELARQEKDLKRIKGIQNSIGLLTEIESGIALDLLLSYRAIEAWEEMVNLYESLSEHLKRSVLIREQLGFAYNRLNKKDQAIEILEDLIHEHGVSSETCSILGRVYKDKWMDANQNNQTNEAIINLDKAIEKYVQGFEADWRDAYPGINAITLLDIKGDSKSIQLKQELLPIVRFAVHQRLKHKTPDYWDHATLLELDILGNDQNKALRDLNIAISSIREKWEPKTTANNLKLIANSRFQSNQDSQWIIKIIEQLESCSI